MNTTPLPKLVLRLCGPRGFCAGVDRAIQMVVLALKKYGAPVYVRHEIVHNRYVVEGLEAKGAIFVKELDQIPKTGQPVIFSAHGVPKSVPADAKNRSLIYLDATCPLVSKVHKQALRHIRKGRHVLLIGHAGHPEVIGTMGQVTEGDMTLIETVTDAASYEPEDASALGYVTQTTLSVDDTTEILDCLKARFPELADPAAESICYATTNRQESVKAAAVDADHFLIVGAPNSSNSKRLVEVASKAGAKRAMLVQGAHEIRWEEFVPAPGRDEIIVGLSAGASAPEILVDQIIAAFRERYDTSIELSETVREDEDFPVVRDLRDTELTEADMAFVNGTLASQA